MLHTYPHAPVALNITAVLTIESRPGLVDDVQTDGAGHLVDVGVVHLVHEADAGRLERVVFGQEHAHPPHTALVWRWGTDESQAHR